MFNDRRCDGRENVQVEEPHRRLVTEIQWETLFARLRGECGWTSEIFRRGNRKDSRLPEMMRV